MPHLEEGIVHAYLDDELDLSERREVDSHLRGCGQCRQLLEEAQGFMTEADRLVAAIEVPLPSVRVLATAQMVEAGKAELAETRSPTPRRGSPPQLRWFAWAATVVVAVGLGYFSNEIRHSPKAAVGEADKAEGEHPATGATLDKQAAESATSPTAAARPTTTNEAASRQRAGQGERRVAAGSSAEPKPGQPRASAEGAVAATAPVSSPQRRDELGAVDAVIAPAPPASPPAAKMASGQSVLEVTRANNALHPVALEDAVRLLGGTVRLIDGMTPKRVLAGPAQSGPGKQFIRVVYEDPPGRELWLDQQRDPDEAKDNLQPPSESNSPVLLRGDTLVAPGPTTATRIQWIDQNLFRLTLTGYLPGDSLRALVRRVR